MDKTKEYNFWLEKKYAYERNLRMGIGDTKTIQFLIEKINIKLNKLLENEWVLL